MQEADLSARYLTPLPGVPRRWWLWLLPARVPILGKPASWALRHSSLQPFTRVGVGCITFLPRGGPESPLWPGAGQTSQEF